MGDAAEVPWRWFGGLRCAGRVRGAAVRGTAGSWGIGGLGGELSHRAFVKFTWSLPLLIIKQLAPKKVQVSPIWFHLEPQCALEWPRMAITVPGEFHEASSRGRLIDRTPRTPLDNAPGHIRSRDGIDLCPSSDANPSRQHSKAYPLARCFAGSSSNDMEQPRTALRARSHTYLQFI